MCQVRTLVVPSFTTKEEVACMAEWLSPGAYIPGSKPTTRGSYEHCHSICNTRSQRDMDGPSLSSDRSTTSASTSSPLSLSLSLDQEELRTSHSVREREVNKQRNLDRVRLRDPANRKRIVSSTLSFFSTNLKPSRTYMYTRYSPSGSTS